jgi:hypothetical protein
MKKLLVLVLSAFLSFSFAAVSFATAISPAISTKDLQAIIAAAPPVTTLGEVDCTYDNDRDLTYIEAGLYEIFTLNPNIVGCVGFWFSGDDYDGSGWSNQGSNCLNYALVRFQLGKSSLQVGRGRTNLLGDFDVLGDDGKTMYKLYGGTDAPVNLFYIAPVTDSLTIKAGYFHNLGAFENEDGLCYYKDFWTSAGINECLLGANYTLGEFNGEAYYLYDIARDTHETASKYIVDVSYHRKNYKIYGNYMSLDDHAEEYAFLGAQANFGSLALEYECCVSQPDSAGDEKPYGYKITYNLARTTSLSLQRRDHTYTWNSSGNTTDADYLKLIVVF